MSLTKDRIVAHIHQIAGMTKCKSARSVEATLEIIKDTLESNEDVLISGFGKFSIRDNSRRRSGSQTNGNAYIPDANKIVTFKCSPVLTKKINGKK